MLPWHIHVRKDISKTIKKTLQVSYMHVVDTWHVTMFIWSVCCADTGVLPKFSPPHISIIVSYFPIFSKKSLSITNNPPAMMGVLARKKTQLYLTGWTPLHKHMCACGRKHNFIWLGELHNFINICVGENTTLSDWVNTTSQTCVSEKTQLYLTGWTPLHKHMCACGRKHNFIWLGEHHFTNICKHNFIWLDEHHFTNICKHNFIWLGEHHFTNMCVGENVTFIYQDEILTWLEI